jgi:membrane protease YdiL (CAAX protease family)
MIEARKRPFAAIPVLILLQLPLAGYIVPGAGFARQVEREAIFWALTAALILYIRFAERRPFSSVGLGGPRWKSLVFGIAGGLVVTAAFAAVYFIIFPALRLADNPGAIDAVMQLPPWFKLALLMRAAVFEELFYRGFAIERLTELTGSRWIAAAISLAAFTIAHLDYWGWAHLILAATGGAILTALYLWRRDLVANMIAHFLTDALALLAG